VQAALEEAYRNQLMVGRFPACVLNIELPLGAVDVNVHPAKTEVKFSQEKQVFDLVYNAVRLALEQEDRTAEVAPSAATRRLIEPKADFYRSMRAESFRANHYAVDKPRTPAAGSVRTPASTASADCFGALPGVLRAPDYAEQTRLDLSVPSKSEPVSPKIDKSSPVFTTFSEKSVENSVQNVESAQVPSYKLLGETMNTYILVESGEQLLLIDKHAAHERMNFDRLKAMDRSIMAQELLEPLPLRASPEDAELLEQNGPLLRELGFELEPFGEEAWVIRAVPADIASADALAAVEEILEKLRSGKAPDAQSARDEILHTVACKAAIKAGWDTGDAERRRIAEAVLSGQVKYCPHGRPVSVVLSRRDLDKMFKRIV
jgi:DNA mismatch repair protein MutL